MSHHRANELKIRLLEESVKRGCVREYLEKCTPTALGVWDHVMYPDSVGRAVAIEWTDPEGRTFWDDENILGSNCVIIVPIRSGSPFDK